MVHTLKHEDLAQGILLAEKEELQINESFIWNISMIDEAMFTHERKPSQQLMHQYLAVGTVWVFFK